MKGHSEERKQENLLNSVLCTDGKKHIFLTGDRKTGKSTVIDRVLESIGCRTSGFRTIKTDKVFENKSSIHLLSVRKDDVPEQDNFIAFCGKRDGKVAERFNKLGVSTLDFDPDTDLIIMDELGPHEEEAEEFKAKIISILNGNIPVLGVLQKSDSRFLSEISNRKDVYILNVTEENRNELPGIILGFLQEKMKWERSL